VKETLCPHDLSEQRATEDFFYVHPPPPSVDPTNRFPMMRASTEPLLNSHNLPSKTGEPIPPPLQTVLLPDPLTTEFSMAPAQNPNRSSPSETPPIAFDFQKQAHLSPHLPGDTATKLGHPQHASDKIARGLCPFSCTWVTPPRRRTLSRKTVRMRRTVEVVLIFWST